jgi:hypothetical protein
VNPVEYPRFGKYLLPKRWALSAKNVLRTRISWWKAQALKAEEAGASTIEQSVPPKRLRTNDPYKKNLGSAVAKFRRNGYKTLDICELLDKVEVKLPSACRWAMAGNWVSAYHRDTGPVKTYLSKVAR